MDRRAASWSEQTYLHQWVATIEQLGFKFFRHQLLQRSHALAFVTLRDSGGTSGAAAEAPPVLLMRSEQKTSSSSTYNPAPNEQ